ncbi:hypothetical protein [Roseateles sp. P5_E7]
MTSSRRRAATHDRPAIGLALLAQAPAGRSIQPCPGSGRRREHPHLALDKKREAMSGTHNSPVQTP